MANSYMVDRYWPGGCLRDFPLVVGLAVDGNGVKFGAFVTAPPDVQESVLWLQSDAELIKSAKLIVDKCLQERMNG